MNTKLKAVDEIVKENTGQLITFCGDKKVHLDILFKQIMNNILKQGKKCLSFEKERGVSIETFKRFECDGYNRWGLKKEDFDLHNIYFEDVEKIDLKKLWTLDLFSFDDVFVFAPSKELTKEIYIELKNIAVQKKINVFVLPLFEVGKFRKKNKKMLLEVSDYLFEIEKTYNFCVRLNHPSEFDVDIYKGSELNKKTARLCFLGIEKIFDVGEDVCNYM